ncbi:hypothetical protein [Siccirubricoccus sp. G192]|uniref:hypothetical protein n=1 Tax=Siccirubricoccus sp. G192 TaxID=2849651 RepID=UPI001C2B994F|nr:hypothetical protein [Siccirubricoccus sp. G192]MBV1796390.1 hypothetical protein [Siccirubricoccus sp. G192]
MFGNMLMITPAVLGLGLALGLAGGALAAEPHAHAGEAAATITLDHGRQWPSDAALRQGMTRLRGAMAAALPAIHANRLPAAGFATLADQAQAQVDYVAENCKLPEAADAQLHLVLAQILDGIDVMKGEGDRTAGAAAVVQALNAYGEAFDHPGWVPLGH